MIKENKQERRCKNCVHFYQHYGLKEKGYYSLNCGHCGKNISKRSLYPEKEAKECKDYEQIKTRELRKQNEKITNLKLNEMHNALTGLANYLDIK